MGLSGSVILHRQHRAGLQAKVCAGTVGLARCCRVRHGWHRPVFVRTATTVHTAMLLHQVGIPAAAAAAVGPLLLHFCGRRLVLGELCKQWNCRKAHSLQMYSLGLGHAVQWLRLWQWLCYNRDDDVEKATLTAFPQCFQQHAIRVEVLPMHAWHAMPSSAVAMSPDEGHPSNEP